MKRRLYPELVLLAAAAIVSRTWQLFTPKAVVFDEVYFKAFAGHYLDGHYFFDIHPPFGKLLLAGWAHFCGLSGADLASGMALQLRVVPAVFGILIIPLVWGIVHRLTGSRWLAFIASFLVLVDNALAVESRFILTDTILIATGLGCLYTYLVARSQVGWCYTLCLASAALLGGMSVSTKWTGLTALALVGLMWLYDARSWFSTVRWWQNLAILVIVPLSLYAGLFALHFALLPSSGDGDAFMSTRFQSSLYGSPYYSGTSPMSFPAKFIELNIEMFRANQTLTATHPYGSHWYSWPLELRPIYYWQGETLADGRQGNIYLLGNPIVWWGSAVAFYTGLMLFLIRFKHIDSRRRKAVLALTAGYLMNYLPFIGVTRVMFLYHYFFSWLYGLMAAALIWGWILDSAKLSRRTVLVVITTICVLSLIGFIYFAPLTYGSPLSPAGLHAHMWLSSWR